MSNNLIFNTFNLSPLIRPIREQAGTFYTFPSAIEDFNFTTNNPNTGIKFSKFALLNIPDIRNSENGENLIQLGNIPGAFPNINQTSTNQNINFIESFQNYCLNLETILTLREDYDQSKKQTVSERVFFKWLKEIGAIRYKEAEASDVFNSGFNIGQRFKEEPESSIYNRVIQCIGDITQHANSKYRGNSQIKIYTYIPTESGNSPTVLLYSNISDSNYTSDMILTYSPPNTLDREYIAGRNSQTIHPNNLQTVAFYDSPVSDYSSNEFMLKKRNDENVYVDNSWWFENPTANTYYTEPNMLNNPNNDYLMIESLDINYQDIKFTRSKLDGVGIDFDLVNYKDAYNVNAKNWSDFNKSDKSTSFEFNAILIYYDIFNKSNTEDKSTNLYGVYFLDKVTPSSIGGGEIKRKTKYKPSASNGNGNSYGYDYSIRLDTDNTDSIIVNGFNQYDSFSMHSFSEALKIISNIQNTLTENIIEMSTIRNDYNSFKDNNYNNSESLLDLNNRITKLEESFISNQAYFNNTKSIMELINSLKTEIFNIYDNKTSVNMSYNLDVIKGLDGIEIDRDLPNRIAIRNNINGYNFDIKNPKKDPFKYDNQSNTAYSYYFNLYSSTNYIIFEKENNQTFISDRDINIFINDTNNKFKNGQIVKISFKSEILFETYNISSKLNLYTNADKNYNVLIGSISNLDFLKSEGKPYIEIICIDKDNYIFSIEKLR